jgi:TRAP-type mannitol/chloroaromatic compound transport system permease small subunit
MISQGTGSLSSISVRLLRGCDLISRVAGRAIAFLVPIMTLVICYEVVSRYFFNAPTIWAYDLSIFMFGYVVLLTGAYVQEQRRHIRIDLIYNYLSERTRAWLDVLGVLMSLLFLGAVVVYGWDRTMHDFSIGARLSSEWAPPRTHFTFMVPLGAALLMLQCLADGIRSLHFAVTGRRLEP